VAYCAVRDGHQRWLLLFAVMGCVLLRAFRKLAAGATARHFSRALVDGCLPAACNQAVPSVGECDEYASLVEQALARLKEDSEATEGAGRQTEVTQIVSKSERACVKQPCLYSCVPQAGSHCHSGARLTLSCPSGNAITRFPSSCTNPAR
jgi:hypothetical protein